MRLYNFAGEPARLQNQPPQLQKKLLLQFEPSYTRSRIERVHIKSIHE
jgi:hypothetical protein